LQHIISGMFHAVYLDAEASGDPPRVFDAATGAGISRLGTATLPPIRPSWRQALPIWGSSLPGADLGVPSKWCHGGVRSRLAASRGLLEQHAGLDLRGPFRLACSPQADLPACQRISPRVAAYAERAAGWLLNVTTSGLTMTAR
jgi:hypothetical protein